MWNKLDVFFMNGKKEAHLWKVVTLFEEIKDGLCPAVGQYRLYKKDNPTFINIIINEIIKSVIKTKDILETCPIRKLKFLRLRPLTST